MILDQSADSIRTEQMYGAIIIVGYIKPTPSQYFWFHISVMIMKILISLNPKVPNFRQHEPKPES